MNKARITLKRAIGIDELGPFPRGDLVLCFPAGAVVEVSFEDCLGTMLPKFYYPAEPREIEIRSPYGRAAGTKREPSYQVPAEAIEKVEADEEHVRRWEKLAEAIETNRQLVEMGDHLEEVEAHNGLCEFVDGRCVECGQPEDEDTAKVLALVAAEWGAAGIGNEPTEEKAQLFDRCIYECEKSGNAIGARLFREDAARVREGLRAKDFANTCPWCKGPKSPSLGYCSESCFNQATIGPDTQVAHTNGAAVLSAGDTIKTLETLSALELHEAYAKGSK